MALAELIRLFNIFCGLFVITIGIWILQDFIPKLSPEYFAPYYIIIFGLIMVLNEFNINWISQNMKFQKQFRKGLYNIFIATLVSGFYNENDNSIRSNLALVNSIILGLLALAYLYLAITKGISTSVDNQALLS